MTLIVSALSEKVVAHVSDTRHTYVDSSGMPLRHDDGKVKSIVVIGSAGCYIISYCGLGSIENKKTDRWIVDKLVSFSAAKKELGVWAKFLEESLGAAIPTTSPNHRTSVVVSGWQKNKQGKYLVRQVLISNYERPKRGQRDLETGPVDKFETYTWSPRIGQHRPYVTMVNGAEDATKNRIFDGRMKKLIKLIRVLRPGKFERLKQSMAQLVKIAANDQGAGSYISPSSIVTILPLKPFQPESAYFEDVKNKKEVTIAPHVVGESIAFRDVSYSGGSLDLLTF